MKLIKLFISLKLIELLLRASKFIFFIVIANIFIDSTILGEYSYFVSIFSIAFVICDFGFNTQITKELSISYSIKKRKEYIYLHILKLIFTISIFFLIIYYFKHYDKLYIVIAIALFFISDTIFTSIYSIDRAFNRFENELHSKFFISLIYLSSVIFILFDYIDNEIFFLSISILSIVLAIYIGKKTYLKKINFALLFKYFKFSTLTSNLKNSYKLFLGSIFTIIYFRVDIIMLEALSNIESVSLYFIAFRVLELAIITPTIISNILIAKLTKNELQNSSRLLFINFIIGIALYIIFYFVSDLIINTIFKEYIASIKYFRILAISIPILTINNYIFTLFVAKDLSKYYMSITAIMMIFNIILNYFSIPIFGVYGAIYSTLLTELIGMLIALYIFYQNIDFK